jgi:hypothetical protein
LLLVGGCQQVRRRADQEARIGLMLLLLLLMKDNHIRRKKWKEKECRGGREKKQASRDERQPSLRPQSPTEQHPSMGKDRQQ